MAITLHPVMLDPNKYMFSETPWIILSIGDDPKRLRTTGVA